LEAIMTHPAVGLLLALVLGLLVAPLTADTQSPGKVFRLGILGPLTLGPGTTFHAFTQRLQELGYVEGHNLALEARASEGQLDRLPGLAAKLVRLNVDVIVARGPEAALWAARNATDTIPIVISARDYNPMALGYVASLARPGGNITGVVEQWLELTAKHLELVKEALPTVTRVAVLWDDASADQLGAAEASARPLGVQLQALELRHPPYEFEGAFATAAQGQAEALVVLVAPGFAMQSARIVDLAAKRRLPTMFGFLGAARAG
jgi:putative ABC transport system substrate-binding protein